MFNATFVQFHHEKTSIFSAVPTSISGGYRLPRQRQTDFCFSRTCTASLIFCFSFLGPSSRGGGWISPCFTQHRTSKLEVPISLICLAYLLGLCKGISPQNMAKNMVQYLHFRILKSPLTGEDLYLCYLSKQFMGQFPIGFKDFPLKTCDFQSPFSGIFQPSCSSDSKRLKISELGSSSILDDWRSSALSCFCEGSWGFRIAWILRKPTTFRVHPTE